MKILSDLVAIVALVVVGPAAIVFVVLAWVYHGLTIGSDRLKSVITGKGGDGRVVNGR